MHADPLSPDALRATVRQLERQQRQLRRALRQARQAVHRYQEPLPGPGPATQEDLMWHPDEDRTDVFELADRAYDQQAVALAPEVGQDLIHRHARYLCEDGYPQARFRRITDSHRTLWADDPQTMEITCTEEEAHR